MWKQALAPDPRDGSILLTYEGGWAQRIGQVSPFEGQTICLQTHDKLSALDPLSGRILWSRLDVNSHNFLFSDEDYVFVVELDNQGKPSASRVFRAADGMSVKAPDFAALFEKRRQVFGRYLLLSESAATNGVTVRLYDMATGDDVWKQNYLARSIVANSEDAALTGIVEPDGKVHVIDLRERKEVFAGQMTDPAENLKGVQRFALLADRINYYFAPQAAEQNGPVQTSVNNVMTQLGMRTLHVNGMLYAFNREKKVESWYFPVADRYMILDQFQEVPLIFLTSRTGDMPNGVPINVNRGMPAGTWTPRLTTIHKGDSRTVFNDPLPSNGPNFFGVQINARANTVELLSQDYKIVHYPAPPKPKKVGEPAAEAPLPQGKSAPVPLKAVETRINRPGFDRARIREIAPPLPPG